MQNYLKEIASSGTLPDRQHHTVAHGDMQYPAGERSTGPKQTHSTSVHTYSTVPYLHAGCWVYGESGTIQWLPDASEEGLCSRRQTSQILKL